jgi:hypothetical protein
MITEKYLGVIINSFWNQSVQKLFDDEESVGAYLREINSRYFRYTSRWTECFGCKITPDGLYVTVDDSGLVDDIVEDETVYLCFIVGYKGRQVMSGARLEKTLKEARCVLDNVTGATKYRSLIFEITPRGVWRVNDDDSKTKIGFATNFDDVRECEFVKLPPYKQNNDTYETEHLQNYRVEPA